MRINKYIASKTEHSRRKADELIKAGVVFVNGKLVSDLGIVINPDMDTVKVGEQTIERGDQTEKVYLALNKPRGYVTTRNDDQNRPTVMELVPKDLNLKPVGRLDKDTEGLLLFTNDGDFINHLIHPKFECEKEYLVIADGRLTPSQKERLENGIILDGKMTSHSQIKIMELKEKETVLKIIIHEGRKRQIRKMFASIYHPVKYLKRLRIGKIKLSDLEIGSYRLLSKKEVDVY